MPNLDNCILLTLMNKNIPIIDFEYDVTINGVIKIYHNYLSNEKYAPLGIINYKTEINRGDLTKWIENRLIPKTRISVISSCLSRIISAISLPSSVRYMYPASVTVMWFFSLRFFIAMLTDDFLKFSSLAISTERTTGNLLLRIKIVSK